VTDERILELARRHLHYDRTVDTLTFARALLSASKPAMAQGWKLVPIEPTDDMEAAAEDDYEQTGATFPQWKSSYRAMLATSPAAPSDADNAERQQAYETGYQHGIARTQYATAMGEAATAYFKTFKCAHPLPAQFRWSEVYDAMMHADADAAPAQSGEPVAKDGWANAEVKGLSELCAALERAESKGYLPEAICDAWAKFDFNYNPQPAQTERALTEEIEALKHDNASMLDSLIKESTARGAAEDLLGEIAALKRYHQSTNPNSCTTRSSMVNVPINLLDHIDAAQPSPGATHE